MFKIKRLFSCLYYYYKKIVLSQRFFPGVFTNRRNKIGRAHV